MKLEILSGYGAAAILTSPVVLVHVIPEPDHWSIL